MIEVQLGFRKDLSAILACVFIPEKDILPREFDLLPGNSVINSQNNDLGDPQCNLDRVNQFSGGRSLLLAGIFDPGSNVVGLIATFPLCLHHLGMTQAKKL